MIAFIIFVFFGLVCYFTFYLKTKDVFQPVGVMLFVWLLMAGISQLQLGAYQTAWSFETITIVIISAIVMYFVGLTNLHINCNTEYITKRRGTINTTFRITTTLVFCICFSTIIILLYKNSFFSSADISSVLDKKSGTVQFTQINKRGLSYIASYLPYCTLNSIFELTYGKKQNKRYLYNIFVLIFSIWYIWFISYSRGTLLVIVLGGIFILNSKKKLSIIKMSLVVFTIILFFSFLMILRVGKESIVYEGVTKNPLFNSTYNYIVYCYQNLDSLILDGSPFSLFANVWQSFYKLFGIYNEIEFVEYTTNIYNANTFLYSFYHDLGLLGIILYPGLISYILTCFYNLSFKNIYFILILAVFQKSIFVLFFGNYFITSFSVMFPYFLTGIICFLSIKVSRKIYVNYININK